jgi:hypothetical protein
VTTLSRRCETTAVRNYPPGFEEDEARRSAFIRELTLEQVERERNPPPLSKREKTTEAIPRTLVRFWDEPDNVPPDVQQCLNSWDALQDEGFSFQMFGDASAAAYIADRYGQRELSAFALCRHPAMRSDYFRLCFVLAEGGLYVDADDVLRGAGWRDVFRDGTLKIQPLCYDIPACGMLPAAELRRADLSTEGRIFYVNNNPIAAPAGHPVLRRALTRATNRLLAGERDPEIQSTTGPGNLTAVLAAHAHQSEALDFELLLDWGDTAEPRWELDYRDDERNWRNMRRR